jgi:DNA repair protein RadD
MPIRYYQREAVDSIFDYWSENDGNPLVDMATGVGKSFTLATLFEELIRDYPGLRLLNVVHVIELVLGNYGEFLGVCPFAPAGVYAAAAGRRDAGAQVLFAQLQSVHSKALEIGHVDVLAIDEVHLVPTKDNTMYRTFIADLLAINPDMKIVGLSATPFRLDSGRLDEGDDKLFDRVVYTYGIRKGIDDGYLTPITSKQVETNYDVTGVRRAMGEYKASDYSAAVDSDALNRKVAQEVLDTEGHRKKALLFFRGVEHAERMCAEFQRLGRRVEVVHGGTPGGLRRKLIEQLKAGELWGLCNDNVLSTGTNIVGVDLIVDGYRTMSAVRYIQRAGRGTRVVYPPGFDAEAGDADARRAAIASWIKPNCRYMDFAGNIREHGPVDMIEPKKPGKGEGEAPVKVCPSCFEIVHASARRCTCCGHEFDFEEKPRFEATADTAPILSVVTAEWLPVRQRRFRYHEKIGGTPSVRAEFTSGLTTYKTWLCPQHSGFAKSKADRWWKSHGGAVPFPSTVDEWLSREAELLPTAEIAIKPKPGSKFMDVSDFRAAANDNASNDNVPAQWASDLDDDIPF